MKNLEKTSLLLLLYFSISFLTCSKNEKPAGWIDSMRLLNADSESDNWVSLGRNFMQQHHSPLDQINEQNVSELGFAWEYDARSKRGRVPRGLEATPFVVDGIMFTSGAWGVVYALNAKSGEEIWRYDPTVDASYNRRACCDVVNRGVAVWKGKVYVGTIDGYLVCLDAENGKVIWRKDTFTDRSRSYTITGPPQIANDVVVIGNSGAEFGVRGYITAFDLEKGEQVWRFYTVPGDPSKAFEHPEMEWASKTWDINSDWETAGGGTVWGELAYDPELNLLYVGTGNSSPYPIWFRSPNGGDNLFLCSILAINPDNGRLVWHYQAVPGEIWDYTNTMNIVLANLEIGGKERKVLMQAPKNGFFYVIDRETGELLSAEKYTAANWASHIDLKTGRPVKTEQGWYKDEPKLVVPSLAGGHSWQPMSYSPQTGLVYIPEIVSPFIYKSVDSFKFKKLTFGTGLDYSGAGPPFSEATRKYLKGQSDTVRKNILKAWDPVEQKMVWQIEHMIPGGNGGILSTNGNLVFQGTNTGHLKVYNAETGLILKEIETGTGIMAAPMTYAINGEQYIAVMAGFGGNDLAFGTKDKRAAFRKYQNYGRILAFKLGGKKTPLPPAASNLAVPKPPNMKIDQTLAGKGESIFENYCISCHQAGYDYNWYSQYPNLAKLSEPTYRLLNDIVLKGIYSQNGMASFADVLEESDVEAIKHFLVSRQINLYNKQLDQSKN
ncbi:PQQ-dependent dehydrogenase, methanol/ethanol family [Aestuariivivens sediminicola]|uniref:PQQ-dependent dehydrogenase, methanol/ethanol family n=1 Tax=Aestuariivivens sediminicola TaxID=2913560 RepID=UPI001F588249|nr:PQQ-dependent dehydrogenase, methanol/ethanol family [Aestuariivivens sediminicola]